MSTGESSTPLGRVRGLGAAHHGGEHWVHERLISAASLLLGLWLIISLLLLPSFDRMTLVEWLRAPSGAVPMILLVIVFFKHAIDGLKTVIDDYIDDEGGRMFVNGIVTFAGVGAGSLALFSIAKIAFGA